MICAVITVANSPSRSWPGSKLMGDSALHDGLPPSSVRVGSCGCMGPIAFMSEA